MKNIYRQVISDNYVSFTWNAFSSEMKLEIHLFANLLELLDGPRMSVHDDEVLRKSALGFKIALKATKWQKVK